MEVLFAGPKSSCKIGGHCKVVAANFIKDLTKIFHCSIMETIEYQSDSLGQRKDVIEQNNSTSFTGYPAKEFFLMVDNLKQTT